MGGLAQIYPKLYEFVHGIVESSRNSVTPEFFPRVRVPGTFLDDQDHQTVVDLDGPQLRASNLANPTYQLTTLASQHKGYSEAHPTSNAGVQVFVDYKARSHGAYPDIHTCERDDLDWTWNNFGMLSCLTQTLTLSYLQLARQAFLTDARDQFFVPEMTGERKRRCGTESRGCILCAQK